MISRLYKFSIWNAIRCECDHSNQFIKRSMNLLIRHCWCFESIDCTFWESATFVARLDTNDLSKNESEIFHIWSLCFFARSYHEHDYMIFTCCERSLMCNQTCLCIKSSSDHCIQLVVETWRQMTRQSFIVLIEIRHWKEFVERMKSKILIHECDLHSREMFNADEWLELWSIHHS
jgi:hypothetical protein